MSSGIPALPKKTQFRDPDADVEENEEAMSEPGDDASSVASDADTSSSVADTTDDSDDGTDTDSAGEEPRGTSGKWWYMHTHTCVSKENFAYN